MIEQERIDNEKSELLQDLIAVEQVMEELWKYHKNNPNRVSVEDEYSSLEKMKVDIEEGLKNLS